MPPAYLPAYHPIPYTGSKSNPPQAPDHVHWFPELLHSLTFGEQVKIILGRKGMTIKELAEQVEAYTGRNMSRQNMTQRLRRDNFQEQDMRLIAKILGCNFELNIMGAADTPAEIEEKKIEEMPKAVEKKELRKARVVPRVTEKALEETGKISVQTEKAEILGDVNPYTGKEYASNSVRMHPKRIGYVQVYDRTEHKWTDMTEWAFLGFQERKKALLGKDYVPPVYLD